MDPNGAREWVFEEPGWASPDGEFSGLVYLDVKIPTMEGHRRVCGGRRRDRTALRGARASANLGKALYGEVRRPFVVASDFSTALS